MARPRREHLQGLMAHAYGNLDLAISHLRQADETLEQFAQAELLPGSVAEEALLGRATLLMEAGRRDNALGAFSRLIQAFPHSVRALAGRGDARTFQPGDPDIAALEAYLAEGERRSLSDRITAHFALGKAYLDIQDPARAFHHLDAGNRQKRSTFTYDAAASSLWMERAAEIFTPDLCARLHAAADPSALPNRRVVRTASVNQVRQPIKIIERPLAGLCHPSRSVARGTRDTGSMMPDAVRSANSCLTAHPGLSMSLRALWRKV